MFQRHEVANTVQERQGQDLQADVNPENFLHHL